MLNDFFLLLLDNIRQTTWIEAIAAVTGVVSIWLGRKANVLIFPVGIVSVLLYVYICYNARLYADMGVNFVYFVMSIYGWYNWIRPHKESKSDRLPITFQGGKQRWISIGLALLMFVALTFLLSHCTDSDVPVIDAFTTALCMMAMYLTTQKKVENWIYYIIADFISIPLYVYKGLVFTSLQYSIFLIIAIIALKSWRKEALRHD
ncbi:MAG: nicotinamide riboside transporter PnuC [Candidatus Limimorpha sp.]